jgi:hypothetical protein
VVLIAISGIGIVLLFVFLLPDLVTPFPFMKRQDVCVSYCPSRDTLVG